MKKLNFLNNQVRLAIIVLAVTMNSLANAAYIEPANFKSLKTVDFKNQSGGDSERFQSLVDQLSSKGGIILIKSSKDAYGLNGITLHSNVHVRMEAGVRILQDLSIRGSNVFSLMGDNISIVGHSVKEKAVIEAANVDPRDPDASSFRAVGAHTVNNFWLANLFIEEHNTRFSTIMTKNTAIDGTIEDITMRGAGPGWGLLQMQGGSNIVARNLDGQGGFTLRLEQGAADQPNGIQNLKAKNIIGRHGRAAVLIAPKNKENGVAVIENVESYGCQWAVLSSAGKDGGRFKMVTIKGEIVAHYDDHGSQFRTYAREVKNIQFLPPDQQKLVSTIPGYGRDKFSAGPAAGAVTMSPIDWVVLDKGATVERIGFPWKDPAIVPYEMLLEISENNGKR